jgi:hypothetical protein
LFFNKLQIHHAGILAWMRTLLRTLLSFALIVWLGAEIFFPVVAAITFATLMPDTHTAGVIVGHLLRILHGMGLVSGMVALALLALAPALDIYKPRAVLAPMVLVVAMMACTVWSQYGIIPAMERDRIAAGGAIDAVPANDPSRMDFNRLHKRSESVEESILLMGLVSVALIARAETARS